ncbi:MAG: hypothetical protein BJ554DRAFT_4616 [Olpidium bornovanus]|uniref:Uncharacterized protein n=1 Tax=Olpidium bornovanus TaxID=278681 RepID=A0A8H8DEI9_9FUNG|nr:MAG: hypothetical protein BJ554DRAFT_4616 [Olpidium bornovanus]
MLHPADEPPPSDIVAALNYGCSYFHRRVDLVRYLSRCVTNLRQPGGMIICDAFAGSATGARTKATRNGWFTVRLLLCTSANPFKSVRGSFRLTDVFFPHGVYGYSRTSNTSR